MNANPYPSPRPPPLPLNWIIRGFGWEIQMQAIKQKSNVLAPFSFRSPRRNLMPVICFKTIIFHFLSPLSKADIRGRLPIFSLKEVWIHGKPCFSPYRQRQRTSALCLPLISRKICEITKHPEKRISTLCCVAVATAHSKLPLWICSIRLPQKCKQKKKTHTVLLPRYVKRETAERGKVRQP